MGFSSESTPFDFFFQNKPSEVILSFKDLVSP